MFTEKYLFNINIRLQILILLNTFCLFHLWSFDKLGTPHIDRLMVIYKEKGTNIQSRPRTQQVYSICIYLESVLTIASDQTESKSLKIQFFIWNMNRTNFSLGYARLLLASIYNMATQFFFNISTMKIKLNYLRCNQGWQIHTSKA